MKMIKMNKRFKGIYENYKNSDLYTLNQCYNKASIYKQRAYNYCMDLVNKYNASDYAIISFNGFMFTFGFEFTENNKKMFAYITKDNDFKMEIVD